MSTQPTATAPAGETTSHPSQASAIPSEPLPQDGTVEVENDADSSYGSSYLSDTTSVGSNIYKGIIQNGRRYQATREGDYWGPADDEQFDSMNLGHLMYMVLDSQEQNPLFRAPVADKLHNVLDIGAGHGDWSIDVGDRFPGAHVIGVDLYPVPAKFVPPNVTFEVDDVMKPWTWSNKWDLIHLRHGLGSFSTNGWKGLYKQAYDNLQPGGWIEQVEPGCHIKCDDGTLPADSKLALWGDMFYKIGEKTDRPLNTIDTMKDNITNAGFINVHVKDNKTPIGGWPRHPIYKEAGRINQEQFMIGVEGYSMYLLTRFGEPEPWSAEEVNAHLDGIRDDMANRKFHSWLPVRRVWAQKPYDAPTPFSSAA